jgi:hypothetical protein
MHVFIHSASKQLNMYNNWFPGFLRLILADKYTPYLLDLFIHHSASTILKKKVKNYINNGLIVEASEKIFWLPQRDLNLVYQHMLPAC